MAMDDSNVSLVTPPDDRSGPELQQFRSNERNAELDLDSRLIMRKPL